MKRSERQFRPCDPINVGDKSQKSYADADHLPPRPFVYKCRPWRHGPFVANLGEEIQWWSAIGISSIREIWSRQSRPELAVVMRLS